MNSLRPLDLAVVAAYFVGMIIIGLRFSRRQKTTESYFVADRAIPAWAMGISIYATLISSITFVAYPGNAFGGNWVELVPGFMVVLVLLLAGAVIIPFFREVVRMSAFEYFERRFGPSVRLYTSLAFAAGHFSKMGFVFYLVALTVASLTGWDIDTIILVAGAVTVAYTYVGGLEAVIWTDVAQGVILWLGIIISLVCLLGQMPGGAAAGFHHAWIHHKFSLGMFDWNFSGKGIWVMSIYGFFWYLQKYTADQTIIQRYLVAKSDRAAIRGVGLGALLCLPVWALFLLIGTLTWSFYQLSGEVVPSYIVKADQYYPHFLITHVPTGFAGIILASLFAAAMSTISSDLNCFAVVGVEDFYMKLRPAAIDRDRLLMGRIIVALAGVLCIIVAMVLAQTKGTALSLYFTATSVLAGGLFGVFALAFLTQRAHTRGIWVGVIACILFTAYATFTSGKARLFDLGSWNYGLNSVLIGVIGHFIVFVIGYAASLMLPGPVAERRFTLWGWLDQRRAGKQISG